MKLASWNINSLRKRQDRLFAWLESFQPDVVCLQETKCPDEQFPVLALQAAGYHAVYSGEKSYNGVAILSKSPSSAPQMSLGNGLGDLQTRLIAATINGVRIYSVYVPNGQAVGSSAYQYKMNWFARLRSCLARENIPETIVAGDFNVAPGDLDVHDPELWRGAIMCSDGERAALQGIMNLGFEDSLRRIHPESRSFSWWDYRMLSFPKDRGLRIDLILAGEELMKQCTAAGIDREMRKGKDPSDHAPIWAEFSR
jgi:exodeoxyribonuclease III